MNLADAQARSGKSDRRLLVVRLACLAFLVCVAVLGGARLERAAAQPPSAAFATRGCGVPHTTNAQAQVGTPQLRQIAHPVTAHELEAADPEDSSEDASLISAVQLADRVRAQASYDGKVVFVLGEVSARQLQLCPRVARGPP